MSRSSVWVMDKSFKGERIKEFDNSWLVSPVAWDILLEKYLPNEIYDKYIGKMGYLTVSMRDKTVFNRLNEKINNSPIQEDRVLWELGNQQVFHTKDKKFIYHSLNNFLKINSRYASKLGQHIYERFQEVAEEILNIDEEIYPYVIFKNTSVDDNVEYWFTKYDEEKDEYRKRSLDEIEESVTEFVVIENNTITNFISNLSYFK